MKKNNRGVLVAVLLMLGGLAYAADEITTTLYLKASKGYTELVRSPGTLTLDWNGRTVYGPVVYALDTSYQAMGRGAIVTNGIVFVRHLSTSNTIDVSLDAGVTDHLRLKSSEAFMFRLNPTMAITNFMAKANAATTYFEVTIIED